MVKDGEVDLGVIDEIPAVESEGIPTAVEEQAPAEQELEKKEGSEEGAEVELEDEGDIEISLDGEAIGEEDAGDTPVIRTLRKLDRENKKLLKEQSRRIEELERKPEDLELGEEPTIEDFDWDAEKYKAALRTYDQKKKVVNERLDAQQKEQDVFTEKLNGDIADYQEKRKTYKGKRFEAAEAEVIGALDIGKQNIIVSRMKNPHLVVNAIGLNPKITARLAKITDPVEFAVEITRIENNLKVTQKTPATIPEEQVKGTSLPMSEKGIAKKRDELAAKAAESGDMTEYRAFNKLHKKPK